MKAKELIQNKFSSNRGETIGEVLVALMIVVLSLMMLAGAIVSAGKVNKAANNNKQGFNANPESSKKADVIIALGDVTDEISVNIIEDAGGVVYYVQNQEP